MLSYLTLYPENWQEHSYIALNGVYESAMLKALQLHESLTEIILCIDNDEGGIEAVDRLSDILKENGYTDIHRIAPEYKDWNEQLKALNGAEALPAMPHMRKEIYGEIIGRLKELTCQPYGLMAEINRAYKSRDMKYLTELAVTGSVFFLRQAEYSTTFSQLCAKLRKEYKPYTDKGSAPQKQRDLSSSVKELSHDLRQTGRTREQSVRTAKLLFQLADRAIKVSADERLSEPVQEEKQDEEQTEALCMC